MPIHTLTATNGRSCSGSLVLLEQGDEILTVDLAARGSVPWNHSAALIRHSFLHHYGAEADVSMPFLLTLRSAGAPLATMGIRPASGERLFLENYLDDPVECFLQPGDVPPAVAERRHIVEVGHLAAMRRGAGRPLFVAATVLFRQWGFRSVALTGTREVRSVFRRLGIVARTIATADPARVPGGAQRWGSYYRHAPEVMLASVDASDRVLEERGIYRMLNLRSVRQEGRDEVA